MTNKKTGDESTMSYVLKISMIAGSISALVLLSSMKAVYAGGISSFDQTGFNAEYGEILVEWDIDGIDASDAIIVASGYSTSYPSSYYGSYPSSYYGSYYGSYPSSGIYSGSSPYSSYSSYSSGMGSNPSEKPAMVATETVEFDFTDSPSANLVSLATASTW